MEMRISKPQAGNKFYTTVANGGESACIQGYPTDVCDVLSNCVGYACGRFNEIIGSMKYPYFNCNAERFLKRANDFYPDLKITDYPTLGGIMVFAKGDANNGNDGAGHVLIVEKVIDKNTIYTSESAYGGAAFFNATRTNANGRWGMSADYTFLGNIVNPAIGDEPSGSDVTPNVARDENKDQIEVKEGITDVRVRTNPSLLGDIIGYATPGVYDYFEKVNADEHDWYRIADDQWMAYDAEWENLYPKKEPKEISLGDTVIVNGIGTASSTGEGAQTGRFVDREMKVIMIAGNVNRPNRYALNQYNKGNVNDPTAVTAWFSINDIKRV